MYVVNTSPCSEEGTHWVVYDNYNNYFFDSFGRPPQSYFNISRMRYSRKILQDDKNETCGFWCIYYIYKRNKHINLKRFLQKFTKDRKANDRKVIKWMTRFPTR